MIRKRIVIDTREQKPYAFPDCATIKKALPAGDYSLEGLEECVAIERKSLDDWIQTILYSKARFARELSKLREYAFAAIVIEGSVEDIIHGRYTCGLRPESALAMTCGIIRDYRPIQVIFAGSRPVACATVKALLSAGEKKYANANSN